MGSIYGTGISALLASQAGILTTQHNIANVNTDGYHRQQTIQVTNVPQFTGAGFIGNGVNVDTVKRIYNQYLDAQVLQTDAQQNQLQAYYDQISQIDNMLADQTSGLTPALSSFFQGVGDVAANPSSIPARQSMIGTAQAMVSRIHALDSRLRDIRTGINTQLTSVTQQINSYSTQIASLNKQIAVAESSAGTDQANDLHDQRDQLVANLNKLVKANVVVQSDGSYNVFIGNGQALVVGQSTYQLSARQSLDDQEQLDLFYQTSPGTNNYVAIKSDLLTGGQLGGLLKFRSESLDAAQNALGRVAIGIAQTFNDQHRLGTDLNGLAGGDFFTVGQPSVLPNTQNTGTGAVSASINDVGALTTSDYSLSYLGGNNYSLIRLSDNTTTNFTSAVPATKTVDGMTIKITAVPNANDSFLIRPTRNGSRDMDVAISDASRIAAAAPMRTNATSTNTGTGAISLGSVAPPVGNVTLTFNGAANAFDVVDNTTGATIAAAVPYTGANQVIQYPAGTGWPINVSAPAGGTVINVNKTATSVASGSATVTPTVDNNVTVTFTDATHYNVVDANGNNLALNVVYSPATGATLAYNGWTANLSGAPATGDTFTVAPNVNGTMDNRNALALAALQTKSTMVNNSSGSPTTSYVGAYSQMVSEVGNKTKEIDITNKAQKTLVDQVKQSQQSLSGVNLDEEAANLIRYQQAYQAAGKMIQVATTMFDTLLSLGK
jgi:flagellar hook-associated protein 1 FlgK